MSRAYRITVKESDTRTLQGSDELCTQLELLEILPRPSMGALLKDALKDAGFQENEHGEMVRQQGTITTTIDPETGTVSVQAQQQEELKIEAKKEVQGWDDAGPTSETLRTQAQEQLRQEIDRRAEKESRRLQTEASQQLEQALDDLQPELSRIINQVTRKALKEKAKQLGTVQEIVENPQTGDLTIKIEV